MEYYKITAMTERVEIIKQCWDKVDCIQHINYSNVLREHDKVCAISML